VDGGGKKTAAAIHQEEVREINQLLGRIFAPRRQRGWSRAQKKVVMGDGAEWIWNLAELHFPGAIQGVDLYHARQHLWDLACQLHPYDEAPQKRWMMVQQHRLDEGKIKKLVSSLP